MIDILDRRRIITSVDEALATEVRLHSACAELGAGQNTYRQWLVGDVVGHPDNVHPRPIRALTHEERQAVPRVCHQPQFASLERHKSWRNSSTMGISTLSASRNFYRDPARRR